MVLPGIRRQAAYAFRKLPPEAREDAIQEVVANCLVAFVRLVQLGKQSVAYAGPLARFGICQFRAGRRVGTAMNSKDVLSVQARTTKRVTVERLDCYSVEKEEWLEPLVTDYRAPIPDIVALRVDVPCWLSTLSRRDRRIAALLATGESTSIAARRFKLSAGRISQLRRELFESWHRFHGEPVSNEP